MKHIQKRVKKISESRAPGRDETISNSLIDVICITYVIVVCEIKGDITNKYLMKYWSKFPKI